MPTFESQSPITMTVDIALGAVRVAASDRADTIVEVRPTNEHRAVDVKDAGDTSVEFADGVLVVTSPKRFSLFGKGGSVEVTLSVPTSSALTMTAAIGQLRTTGGLGECTVKLAMGDVRCEDTGALRVNSGMGDVSVERVAGNATVTTGSGAVRLGEVDGTAIVKNSNGATWLGVVTGETRVNAANGDIAVDEAGGSVDARSACGDIRVLGVTRGRVSLQTAAGTVDVGIRQGTAAWLDVSSRVGQVTSALDAANDPGASTHTVEVHARALGDIAVHRS